MQETIKNEETVQHPESDRAPTPRIRPKFQILVECRDEQDQKAFHARMVTERRKCRVLTV